MKWALDMDLAVLFFVLKVTNLVSWPWLWVLSPVWISLFLTGLGVLFSNESSKENSL